LTISQIARLHFGARRSKSCYRRLSILRENGHIQIHNVFKPVAGYKSKKRKAYSYYTICEPGIQALDVRRGLEDRRPARKNRPPAGREEYYLRCNEAYVQLVLSGVPPESLLEGREAKKKLKIDYVSPLMFLLETEKKRTGVYFVRKATAQVLSVIRATAEKSAGIHHHVVLASPESVKSVRAHFSDPPAREFSVAPWDVKLLLDIYRDPDNEAGRRAAVKLLEQFNPGLSMTVVHGRWAGETPGGRFYLLDYTRYDISALYEALNLRREYNRKLGLPTAVYMMANSHQVKELREALGGRRYVRLVLLDRSTVVATDGEVVYPAPRKAGGD